MNEFRKASSSQNKPGCEDSATESLESMSPAELADALERELAAMTADHYDPALIDAYLEVLDRKAPMPEATDAEAALREFNAKLASLSLDREAVVASAGAAKKRPYRRVIFTAAAAIALLFALMLGAQAAGFDVFGSLARWTDEIFHFVPSVNGTGPTSEYRAVFQRALEDNGLPTELAPGWFPDGFQAREPQIWNDDSGQVVQLTFSNEDDRSFSISVERYANGEGVAEIPFEKDRASVEEYIQNGRKFYILSNANSVSAAWADGSLTEIISGRLSVEEVQMIISSIGG